MTIWSRIYKLLGWSPIGKFVEVKVDESSFSSLIGKTFLAKIVSLNNQGLAVLAMSESMGQIIKLDQHVAAQTRHKGYDFYHLGVGTIAVSLLPIDEVLKPEFQDERFAIATIKLTANRQ